MSNVEKFNLFIVITKDMYVCMCVCVCVCVCVSVCACVFTNSLYSGQFLTVRHNSGQLNGHFVTTVIPPQPGNRDRHIFGADCDTNIRERENYDT